MCEADKDKLTIKEKYMLLITARNFHYSNFNKWMTYFYVATAALFVGYCSILTADKIHIEKTALIETVILILGYIVSLFWYWSAKGYYYWNINFIQLVNYYEETLLECKPTERVYKVFYDKQLQNKYENPTSGANISTSKVAIFFAFLITSFWGLILLGTIFKEAECLKCCSGILYCFFFLISMIITIVLSASFPRWFFSSDHSQFPNLVEELEKLKKKNLEEKE